MSLSISRLLSRLMSACLLSAAAGLLGACAQGGGAPEGTSGAALKPADLHWLNTVTFGANQASIERLRKLGRERYLEEQLKAPGTDTGELATTIGALSIAQQSGEQRLRGVRAEQQRINTLTDEDENARRATRSTAAATTWCSTPAAAICCAPFTHPRSCASR